MERANQSATVLGGLLESFETQHLCPYYDQRIVYLVVIILEHVHAASGISYESRSQQSP